MANALASTPAPELVLGRYRPLRPLGSGSSGSVWLARDERTGLDVALKIVPRDGTAGARAEREAEAAALLRHPTCLRAYAYGREAGHVYIAYEYAPGRTLREVLRAKELTDSEAVETCAQLLEGIAHAHQRGVVHRDVKPANVLVCDGSVKLADFGLASFEGAETLTAVGDVPGTLAYISPERLAGEEGTAAADVWAVGVILWEALAGRHPFWRPSLLETGRAIEAGAPPLRGVRPDLPARLLEAVDRALAHDPRKRPTAARLADLLREARPRRRAPSIPSNSLLLGRAARAAVAAAGAAMAMTVLPFWPAWCVPLAAALAGGVAFMRPRLGYAVALALGVFPVGNLSLGLALAYGVAAPAWLALTTIATRSVRRATLTATAVAALQLGAVDVAREESILEAAQAIVVAVPREAWLAALALAAAASTVTLVRTAWRAAFWAGALLAALLLSNPELSALPVVAAAWAAACALAVRTET